MQHFWHSWSQFRCFEHGICTVLNIPTQSKQQHIVCPLTRFQQFVEPHRPTFTPVHIWECLAPTALIPSTVLPGITCDRHFKRLENFLRFFFVQHENNSAALLLIHVWTVTGYKQVNNQEQKQSCITDLIITVDMQRDTFLFYSGVVIVWHTHPKAWVQRHVVLEAGICCEILSDVIVRLNGMIGWC